MCVSRGRDKEPEDPHFWGSTHILDCGTKLRVSQNIQTACNVLSDEVTP